jgi:histidine triad (HIT) family protein
MDCIFCKIAKKEIPSNIIHEDDRLVVFEDMSPQAPVHVLVVPKKHISTTLEIKDEDNELIGHMFQAAALIAKKKGIDERGFRVVMNTNAEAGQTVFHIHLHVLGGRAMAWPPG